jgi:hypothetical protein
VSQPGRPKPNTNVMAWLAAIDDAELAIQRGYDPRPGLWGGASQGGRPSGLRRPGSRRNRHRGGFLGRILPIDSEAAKIWAGLLAQKHKHVNDRALVAIARTHGLILVSGNVKDLVGLGVDVLDPFKRPARLHPAGGVR